MKLSDAVKTPSPGPSLEERLEALENRYANLLAAALSEIGAFCYNDPEFGETVIAHVEAAVAARNESDAIDNGG